MMEINMMERMVFAMSLGKTTDLKHLGSLNMIWDALLSDPDEAVVFMGIAYRDPKGNVVSPSEVVEEGMKAGVDVFIDAYLDRDIPARDLLAGYDIYDRSGET